MTTVAELLQPVESDLEDLLGDLRRLIGAGHPILFGVCSAVSAFSMASMTALIALGSAVRAVSGLSSAASEK